MKPAQPPGDPIASPASTADQRPNLSSITTRALLAHLHALGAGPIVVYGRLRLEGRQDNLHPDLLALVKRREASLIKLIGPRPWSKDVSFAYAYELCHRHGLDDFEATFTAVTGMGPAERIPTFEEVCKFNTYLLERGL